jgi:hypothetical protein
VGSLVELPVGSLAEGVEQAWTQLNVETTRFALQLDLWSVGSLERVQGVTLVRE